MKWEKKASRFATMLRPKTKVYNINWEFHKGDDDFWPSVPHGHSIEKNYTLRLWDGEVYDAVTKKSVGKASKKDMLRLYHEDKVLDFVETCRDEYRKRHPNRKINELICPFNSSMRVKRIRAKRMLKSAKTIEGFKCCIRCEIRK